jgi:aryl-alcohol dehydrogenase-like predicted oxidoreductase
LTVDGSFVALTVNDPRRATPDAPRSTSLLSSRQCRLFRLGRHGKSVAQVALRWLIQRGIVAIPKSIRKERMAENLDIFDFELDAKDIALIAALDQGASSFFDHRDPEIVKRLGTRKLEG